MCAEERCAMREGFTSTEYYPNETTDFLYNAVRSVAGSDAGPAGGRGVRSRK